MSVKPKQTPRKAVHVEKRRTSPRKQTTICDKDRDRPSKAKIISKSLFGASNKLDLKEHFKEETAENQVKAANKWEFNFNLGKPARKSKNFKWEAIPAHSCDTVPTFYQISSIKSRSKDSTIEGQLSKLRYFHPKTQEENEDNTNKVSNNNTVSTRKGRGQTKITDFLKEKKKSTISLSTTTTKRKLRSSAQDHRV